jgi:hypothetical protein
MYYHRKKKYYEKGKEEPLSLHVSAGAKGAGGVGFK